MFTHLLCVCALFAPAHLQSVKYEGDSCLTRAGGVGVCQELASCPSAQYELQIRLPPIICSYNKTEPVVCCDNGMFTPTEATIPPATSKPTTTSTTARPSNFPDYEYQELLPLAEDGCEPLPSNNTSPKTNSKAWNKCIEYQMKLVYPCAKGETLLSEPVRKPKCHHVAVDLVVGGIDAAEDEFPHMALLGYGKDPKTLQWLCGGTIVSDRYILTAGHCTSASRIGEVTYIKVGILKRTDQDSESKVYRIEKIIKHPEYNSPHRYHDIALLRTEKTILLSDEVVPACLDVSTPNKYNRAIATGWGATRNRGANADHLQKVILNKFSTPECAEMFPPHRLMVQGFDEKSQICYGDKSRSQDTCQGDSGGPLQIYSAEINCMYVVVGVTSFGRACGVVGEPGIYTRVANYVSWIEAEVWP